MNEHVITIKKCFVRRNRPTKFFLVAAIAYLIFSLLHYPLPAEAVDPTAVIDAATALADSKDTAIETLWKQYLLPPGPVYIVIVYLASIIAALSLVFVLIKWSGAEDEMEVLEHLKRDMVWIIILLMALSFDGQFIASYTYLQKRLQDSALNRIESFAQYGVKFKQASALTSFNEIIAPQIKACEGKTGQEQIQCLEIAYIEASKLLDEAEKFMTGENPVAGFLLGVNRFRTRIAALGQYIANPEKSVLEKAGTAFFTITSPAWTPIVKGIASGFQDAVFNLIDGLLLFMALAGPIAAALSVAPISTGSKPFILWQLVIFLLFAWKLLLVILDGIASEILLSYTADVDTLWFGFVTAIIFPLVTLGGLIATGGNLFQAISTTTNATVGAVNGAVGLASKTSSAVTQKVGRPKTARAARVR